MAKITARAQKEKKEAILAWVKTDVKTSLITPKFIVLDLTMDRKGLIPHLAMERKHLMLDLAMDKKGGIPDLAMDKTDAFLNRATDKRGVIVDFTMD